MLSSGLVPGRARALRREIIARNRRLAEEGALTSVSSYGPDQVVVYAASEDGKTNGNFFPTSYKAITDSPQWRKRLTKPHSGKRNLPRSEAGKWRELDTCTSSDALLMNIFCHHGALAEGKLHRLMTVDPSARPDFGVRVASPLTNGHRDRTEIDMRFGDLLVEAKLTEADFQSCSADMIERYRDFEEVFDTAPLPRRNTLYGSYQLLRSVLAAHASRLRFCVIADARRPDLREQWFAVMQSVRSSDLRLRCQMLTWQELSASLPTPLQRWLEEKYGIFAPGNEAQLDASEWYW
jgi:restriction endonuclease-like protein